MADNPEGFLYLSQILGKKVFDTNKRVSSRIVDLLASLTDPYPLVTHVLIKFKDRGKQALVPWAQMDEIDGRYIIDARTITDFPEMVLNENELFLKNILLDKQIVDTNGAKIRRVNDLHFLSAYNRLHLVHVDVGFRGLMRRVGLEKVMDYILDSLFDYTLQDHLVSWKFVQPISSPDLLRLNITQNRFAQLLPADLADILEDLDIYKRDAVFQSLDAETAAETLEETDPKIQVSLIESLNTANASDIIEEMSLSEAADLLGELPKDKAEGILNEMEKDFAEDVKELLIHPDEEAGGLMTTSFLRFQPSMTAREVLEIIRREGEEMEFIYYLFIIDGQDRLLGIVSLREILIADEGTRMADIMDTRVVSVHLKEEEDNIVECFTKYGIMAIPVVDDQNKLKGVILYKNLLELVSSQLKK
jgi:magnesium transporter